jgi:SAM-dependent methyltransferase
VKGYEISSYGDAVADIYDELHAGLDPSAAVEALAELAGDGPVLELAIGTGRIALPLAAKGLEVHGIDSSEEMITRLRDKPGGDLPVTVGDFADVGAEGPYRLIFVAFNTFFDLTSQDTQVRCFENVAQRLTEGGVFVIEAFRPPPADKLEGVQVLGLELDSVMLLASRHDPSRQMLEAQYMLLGSEGTRFAPAQMRYAWPSELDLMARLAGLRLRERWASWRKDPFTPVSTQHISVYDRP